MEKYQITRDINKQAYFNESFLEFKIRKTFWCIITIIMIIIVIIISFCANNC